MNSSEPIATGGVDFVYLPTKSFERAEQFYSGVLGLPCNVRYRDIGGEFETGNVTIAMLESEAIGREFAPNQAGAIALHVDDVEVSRKELEAQGVEFSGDILDSGVCHQAFFSDPDGNALILHHRYAPKA